MLQLRSPSTARVALGLASLFLSTLAVGGCTAGVMSSNNPGSAGGGGAPGGGGSGGSASGLGGFNLGGRGGATSTGTGGTLPVPPGCGDGINNQGGIEQCDDGNTLAGDGCNGACHVEPNWTCPPAGACTRTFKCGDGVINPGEVCDDGNTTDGDGCNATCTVQDGRYVCMAGKPCVLSSICGNKRIEQGENCDDGNATAGDGCSATCQLEQGWVCQAPGSPCIKAPRCGDGIVQVNLGEVCDDGNITDGDGCSANCKVTGAGCTCVPGMKCVCPQVVCGDGIIAGNEKCDDGNANSGDGCSSTCTIERGYICPLVKAPCVPDCGDGILTGNEPCDPGITVEKNACSANCRWNPGWACTGSPVSECHQTKCGDGKKEGAEGCDDGNTTPYDGCSATCQNEPNCASTTGACSGKCGDGILLSGEQCDDGNNLSGDGCSADCKTESGFTCTQPPLGAYIDVPVVYRDFKFHHPADFEPGVSGSYTALTGIVAPMLDSAGKPTLAGGAPITNSHITSEATFEEWYRNTADNHATAKTLRLYKNGANPPAYTNRWGPNGEQWIVYTDMAWCDNDSCDAANCQNPPTVGGIKQVCIHPCTPWGVGNTSACFATPNPRDGTPTFFPIDDDTFSAGEGATATIPPPYSCSNPPTCTMGNWPAEDGTPPPVHNFSFTSEVRYQFFFEANKTYSLTFMGDDDVWVFVNRRLAVDLGGIHTPVTGTVNINTGNAFNMTPGNVYEVVVFQTERNKNSSSYQLTLSGFNGAPTACGPTCGDFVVTPPEQCDNGPANTGGYNKCTPDCKLGPFCGDGMVTDGEECDNGTNSDAYGAMSGCGPGCKLPARCGDSKVQTEYGEQCDLGPNNNTGAYGGCDSKCQSAGYCGDGKVQSPQEQCDDGANDGTYGHCGDPTMPLPNCQLGPRCGDGIVQDQYGEECEPTSSSDPSCTAACKKPGVCGDGVTTPPEQCDDGAVNNDGSYGGCAPSCIFAPHCGDGIKNGPEECDDGVNDNGYGGCSPQCKLAAHCGDGVTNPPYEQCDDGVNNGPTDQCSTVCKFNVQ